jgi:hypothetical protein
MGRAFLLTPNAEQELIVRTATESFMTQSRRRCCLDSKRWTQTGFAASLCLPLTHHACLNERFVGGKAVQLTQLIYLQNHHYSVPMGVCVTVAAFDSFVQVFKYMMCLF